MIREIENQPKFLRDEGDKGLLVFVAHKTIAEDSETLVDPQATHGVLGVVVVFVSSEKTLEHLDRQLYISLRLEASDTHETFATL